MNCVPRYLEKLKGYMKQHQIVNNVCGGTVKACKVQGKPMHVHAYANKQSGHAEIGRLR